MELGKYFIRNTLTRGTDQIQNAKQNDCLRIGNFHKQDFWFIVHAAYKQVHDEKLDTHTQSQSHAHTHINININMPPPPHTDLGPWTPIAVGDDSDYALA